ncbi:hypothetical protein FZEAL_9605 [Fusarium zealandicum]|uniref:C2H2-type domain-containing protein n=1 Tax=Fusarium zealandicum TaxID=1053134 RepID=A0A8H4XFK1_9HYPO|nr:hypothetical protein FZEAL_9605 [Fusarium zealandicum]
MPTHPPRTSALILSDAAFSPTLKRFPGKNRILAKFLNFKFSFDTSLIDRRLGYRRSDMPQASEEPVFVKRTKPSSASPEPSSSRKPSHKHSTGGSRKSRSTEDQEESGQDRRGSTASHDTRSGQANPPATRRRSQVVDECARLLSVPLPQSAGRKAADSKKPDVKLTTPSAAYLDYRINQELCRRKKLIVDNLMSAISECFERKLGALEEGCGPGSGPRPSSGAVQAGKQTSRSAGQKRSNRHSSRDESENDNDSDEGFRKKKEIKRAKTTKDDTRPRFACPYHQYDPKKFRTKRTCCGPGWPELSRLKEHLERTHMLPKFQCNRCCRRFKEEDELKQHQRETTPCPVKDPNKIQRDLADGYGDEKVKKLRTRSKKTPEDKWREWYCILFDLASDSPNVPSPYYDNCLSKAGPSVINLEDISGYRDWWSNQAEPAIRQRVKQKVDKAFMNYAPHVKSDVSDMLQDLPRWIADIFPLPGLTSEETSNAVEASGDLDFLESCDDSFDMDAMGDDYFGSSGAGYSDLLGPSDVFISSESSDCSDPYQAGDSSATSVQDDAVYQYCDSKAGLMQTSLDMNYPSNGFT